MGVDREELARYSAIDWGAHAPRLSGRALFVTEGRSTTIARQQGGACVFLDPDNLCVIHRVLGLDAKPKTCRSFPHSFLETPTDVRVGLSWATRGRRPEAAPGEVELREIEETYERDRASKAIFVASDPERVALVDELREHLLAPGDARVDARVIAVRGLLDEVAAGALSIADLPGARARLRSAVALRSAGIPRPGLGRTGVLPLVLSAPVHGPRALLRIALSVISSAAGRYDPPHLGPLDGRWYAEIARVSWPEDQAQRSLWASFASELLLEGLMVETGPISRLGDHMITTYALARWLAKLSALRAGRSVVEQVDAERACADAQASAGPQRGRSGRLVRALQRRSVRLSGRGLESLAALLAAQP